MDKALRLLSIAIFSPLENQRQNNQAYCLDDREPEMVPRQPGEGLKSALSVIHFRAGCSKKTKASTLPEIKLHE